MGRRERHEVRLVEEMRWGLMVAFTGNVVYLVLL